MNLNGGVRVGYWGSERVRSREQRRSAKEHVTEALTVADMFERWPKLSEIIESKGKNEAQLQSAARARKRSDVF